MEAEDVPKSRRNRIFYNSKQKKILDEIYQSVKYPDKTVRKLIAGKIGVSEVRIAIWFQNKRRTEKIEKTQSQHHRELERSEEQFRSTSARNLEIYNSLAQEPGLYNEAPTNCREPEPLSTYQQNIEPDIDIEALSPVHNAPQNEKEPLSTYQEKIEPDIDIEGFSPFHNVPQNLEEETDGIKQEQLEDESLLAYSRDFDFVHSTSTSTSLDTAQTNCTKTEQTEESQGPAQTLHKKTEETKNKPLSTYPRNLEDGSNFSYVPTEHSAQEKMEDVPLSTSPRHSIEEPMLVNKAETTSREPEQIVEKPISTSNLEPDSYSLQLRAHMLENNGGLRRYYPATQENLYFINFLWYASRMNLFKRESHQ